MNKLTHLAARIFSVPLMIERQKMDVILNFLAPRLELDLSEAAEGAQESRLYGPGDTGRSRKSYYVTKDHIAVIDVVGPLVKRASGDYLSGGPTTYSEVENEVMDAVTDPAIDGVLLTVDSPGGESVGAFELSDLIHSQRNAKPIFAVADGDAFSAAYAIASAAERVFVTKSGGVGSIGVWMMHVDQSEANKKYGVKPTYIYAGARKIDGNPHEPLTKEAKASFQEEVDRLYAMFVGTVARNRGLRDEDVRDTEAGLFFGDRGISAGLADEVGGVSEALAALRDCVKRRKSNSSSAPAAADVLIPRKGVSRMDDTTKRAAAEQAAADEVVEQPVAPAEKPEEQPQQEPQGEPEVEAPVESDGGEALAYAVDVAEFCVLAGQAGKIAGFLRARTSLAEVRKTLMAARAADESETIHSLVLPETGASAETKVTESPIVRAAEKLANVGKEK